MEERPPVCGSARNIGLAKKDARDLADWTILKDMSYLCTEMNSGEN